VAAPGSGDDDPERESRAYNDNIYLMVAAPYVLFGFFCLLVYRGFKKLQQAEAARAAAGFDDPADSPGGGDSSPLPPPEC
jgi:hypothetical protein